MRGHVEEVLHRVIGGGGLGDVYDTMGGKWVDPNSTLVADHYVNGVIGVVKLARTLLRLGMTKAKAKRGINARWATTLRRLQAMCRPR